MTPSGCPVTPGFPIRKSPDQSSFDSSPGLIAAYHVLHRLSTPRHPPCTLNSLTTIMRGCQPAPRGKRPARTDTDNTSRSSSTSGTRDSRFTPPTTSQPPTARTFGNFWLDVHKPYGPPTTQVQKHRKGIIKPGHGRPASASSIVKERARQRTASAIEPSYVT